MSKKPSGPHCMKRIFLSCFFSFLTLEHNKDNNKRHNRQNKDDNSKQNKIEVLQPGTKNSLQSETK